MRYPRIKSEAVADIYIQFGNTWFVHVVVALDTI